MATATTVPIVPIANGTPTPPPPPNASVIRTCVFGNPYPGQYSTNFYGLSTTGGGSAFGYMLLAAWPMPASACVSQTPTPPPPPPLAGTLPCLQFTYTNGTAALDCLGYAGHSWSVAAHVASQCPINEVLRAPYPRTLVNLDTSFKLLMTSPDEHWSASLSHPDVANGSAIDAAGLPTRGGLFRDLSIALRSRRLTLSDPYWIDQRVPAPTWRFSDHAWNAGFRRFPAEQQSNGNGLDSDSDALFEYETSSWGLPLRGRAFDFALDRPSERYDLPAYAVSLAVPCGHEWRVRWDESVHEIRREDYAGGQCFNRGAISSGDPTLRSSESGCPPGQEHYWNEYESYHWDHHDTGWNKIDLRSAAQHGSAFYLMSTTRPGGAFKNATYWEGVREIRVPVIEVQSVARASCVVDGTCAPPEAEPGSLRPTPASRVDP